MTSQGPLTAWLLSISPQSLKRATTHPFLAAAGQGTLPKATLSQWLAQDRLYAQSYIRFIGLLLTKIRLPPYTPSIATTHQHTPEHQAVDILIDALVNIRTELEFFEATAAAYDLDLTAIHAEEAGPGLAESGSGSITTSSGISTTGSGSCPGSTGAASESGKTPKVAAHTLCDAQGECQMPEGTDVCYPPSPRYMQDPDTPECEPCRPSTGRPSSTGPQERDGTVFFTASRTTRAYIDLFMSAGSSGVSVLEGMAVLWATEVCYLRAWRYAAAFLKQRGLEAQGVEDADGGALREKFIPNWSSVEFERFVDSIGDVLDTMASQIKGAEEVELMRGRCLEWWKQVIWLEERFWPAME